MHIEPINEFRGDNAFLSNFYESAFEWRGALWETGENAFQFAKTFHASRDEADKWKPQFLIPDLGPGLAKSYGRQIKINVHEWDQAKVGYMREIVHAKFEVPDLEARLLRTGAAMLVEGNTWGDTFWGRCFNENGRLVGLNILGSILMEERGVRLWRNEPPF